MYPHERSLVKQMENQPFAIIGINSDRDRDRLKEVVKEKGLTWRSFFDGGSTNGPIASKWNIRGWPTTFLIDAKGIIRYKNVRGARVDRAVEKLLAEMDIEVSILDHEEFEKKQEKEGSSDSSSGSSSDDDEESEKEDSDKKDSDKEDK